MNVLIVEDEIVAANRLQKLITESDPEIKVMDILESVLDTTNFLAEKRPDLIFLDIQLSDGICFEIFEQMEVDIPIIFTTAYDEFMQKAFKVNSIDYLLKPIRQEELDASILKFRKTNSYSWQKEVLKQMLSDYIHETGAYKCRFMVKSGRGFISVDIDNVAYFLSEHRLSFLITNEGKKYVLDQSLEQLEKMLDPNDFIKISRNYILSNHCIRRLDPYFNNRMIVEVDPPAKDDVLVGRAFTKNFKEWLNK